MMEIRNKAIADLRDAVASESKGDLSLALEQYKEGIGGLLQAIKCVKPRQMKEM